MALMDNLEAQIGRGLTRVLDWVDAHPLTLLAFAALGLIVVLVVQAWQ